MAIQTFEELEVYAGFKYEASLSTSLLSYALTISPSHIAFGSLSGNSYAGNDLPDSGYNTSTFYINCRNANSISVYLTPDDNSLSPQLNKYTGTWSGWQSIGGDNKFIKGQAIPFYDTDGETLINSVLPENLVYYDGESGEDVASNIVYANCSDDVSLSSASTWYYPTLVISNSKGNGFEIANNGDIKCNKNGKIKVFAKAYMTKSNLTGTWAARIAVNRSIVNGTAANIQNVYHGTLFTDLVVDVVAGDTINLSVWCNNAGATLSSTSSVMCEYIEDYYITQALSNTKKVLYSGGTYTTTSVTLSENVSKYDYLKIIFVNNDSVYSSVDIYQPDGKIVTAWVNTNVAASSYAKAARFQISGNTISNYESQKQHYFNGSSVTTTTVQNVGIYAVIGEKFGDKPDTDIDKIYPVGSIYMSVNNTNPSELFGGTWAQIKDTFLLSAGDTYTAGDTGGEATHTLTVNEIPSHTHRAGIDQTGYGGTIPANHHYFKNSSTVWGYTTSQMTDRNLGSFNLDTGGGQAHNNMPPYLVVYIWQRIA